MVVTETASLIALDGSRSSIQVSVTQSEATTFLSEQPTQLDESMIVVAPGTRQPTQLERLERRLDEVMQERVQLSAQLQAMLRGHNLRAPLFGCSFLMPGIEAMKLIGCFAWSFLLIRFIYVSDLSMLLGLFGSISLTLLVFGFSTEEHFFLWPFVMSCVFEWFAGAIQMSTIGLLLIECGSDIRMFEAKALEQEAIFSYTLLREMISWPGITKVLAYSLVKMSVFFLFSVITSRVACILYTKEHVIDDQRNRLDTNHYQMLRLMHQLDFYRRANLVAATPAANPIL
ncbi:hypothetical protein M3Y98_00720200 [Aphelenchoides besseyi]|nr:hypothetical protein M3Y98_00720200 [Aphelenchoides besseyi]KAI6210227.1 hypothetical protein M3Y96_00305400 [Aphelenchoides besseyi]